MATDRTEQAKQFLARISRTSGGLESVSATAESTAEGALERAPLTAQAQPALAEAARSAARKVETGEPMTPHESFALEAIIIPDKRPAIDIINGNYQVSHPDWLTF